MAALPTASFAATESQDASTSMIAATLEGSYTRGKYGSLQSSAVETLTSGLEWTVFKHTTLSASIPFLIQEAPRGTVGGGKGGTAHRGNNRGTRTQQITTAGLGDVVIGIDQDLLNQSAKVPVDIGAFAEIKFGTADVAKGLGSGQNDYTFGGRIGHTIGQVYLSGEAGYIVVGNPGTVTANGVTTTLNYRNAAFGALAGTYDLNDHLTLGTSLNAIESYERGLPATLTLNGSVAYHLTHAFMMKAGVLAGLNNNSPNYGLSLMARLDL
ncbi:MAG: hypothetical protein NVS9B10_26500 [Nevskia sp.]